jgi:hypothetical protein
VTLLHEIGILNRRNRTRGNLLCLDSDGFNTIVGAKVVFACSTASLAGNVELPSRLVHARVWDGGDPIVKNRFGLLFFVGGGTTRKGEGTVFVFRIE